MKNVIFFVIGLFLILLEFLVLNRINLLPININLLLIYIICLSLFTDFDKALFFGLVFGTAKDFAIERIVGINALLFIFLSIGIHKLQQRVYKDKPLTPLFFNFISSFFYSILYVLLHKMYLRSSFLLLPAFTILPQFLFWQTLIGSFLFLPFKNMIYFVEDRW